MLSRAVTKPFIAPLFQESCCGSQLWLVEGSVLGTCAVRVGVERVQVPVGIVRVRLVEDHAGIAVGSLKPRTPGMAPK